MNYRPLHEYLTIKESKIEGLGLFATDEIYEDICLGVTHVHDIRFEDSLIRTPLGGFINHNDDPNLVLIKENDLNYVRTIREVKVGEELTLKYTLYNVCGGTDFDTKGACVDMI